MKILVKRRRKYFDKSDTIQKRCSAKALPVLLIEKLLREMKEEGYKIHLFFLWIRSSELAHKRVKERVSMGGHDVPAQTILRRFNRGINNLFHLYRPFLDSWMLFDNSGHLPMVLAKETDGVKTIIDDTLFAEITRELEVL